MRSAFPGYRVPIDDVVAEVAAYGGFATYSLLSEVFCWSILEAALQAGRDEFFEACFDFIEWLLGSPDQNIRDPAQIRVVPYMLQNSRWQEVTRRSAGPLLTRALDEFTGDAKWRAARAP